MNTELIAEIITETNDPTFALDVLRKMEDEYDLELVNALNNIELLVEMDRDVTSDHRITAKDALIHEILEHRIHHIFMSTGNDVHVSLLANHVSLMIN